jgi:hypothetical protein
MANVGQIKNMKERMKDDQKNLCSGTHRVMVG